MFYCDKCRVKNGWPMSFMGSRGPCEVCDEVAVCNDTPSRYLCDPPPDVVADHVRKPELPRYEPSKAALKLAHSQPAADVVPADVPAPTLEIVRSKP